MGEIEIRPAVAADADGYLESSAGLFAEDAGSYDDTIDIEWPRKYGRQRFLDGLAEPQRLVLLAIEDGGTVVGHLSGQITEPTTMRPVRVATLTSLFVFADYRRTGVAGRMVAGFRSWAQGRNVDRLEVTAYAANEGALTFYRRQGFAPQSVLLEAMP